MDEIYCIALQDTMNFFVITLVYFYHSHSILLHIVCLLPAPTWTLITAKYDLYAVFIKGTSWAPCCILFRMCKETEILNRYDPCLTVTVKTWSVMLAEGAVIMAFQWCFCMAGTGFVNLSQISLLGDNSWKWYSTAMCWSLPGWSRLRLV